MKLVYWPIPGRAHVTRAILHYHEHPFEDIHQKREDWPAEKEALKAQIPYPNLPYSVDGFLQCVQKFWGQFFKIRFFGRKFHSKNLKDDQISDPDQNFGTHCRYL